jgi:hypothetical protein
VSIRNIFIMLAGLALAACSSTRGGFVDAALDKALFKADTKAERLLRYFEVQALLVRFAAQAAPGSDRDTIAMANARANAELVPLIECLQYGSVGKPDASSKSIFEVSDVDVAVRQKYCSFFDSRMIKYEGMLLSLLKLVIQDDLTASNLKDTITGTAILDFGRFVNILVTFSGNYIRDERILSAFKADALELQVIIWNGNDYQMARSDDDDQKAKILVSDPNFASRRVFTIKPEREDLPGLQRTVWQQNQVNAESRPTIQVWHFQQVYAFMLDSCKALNEDQIITGTNKLTCSSNLVQTPPETTKPASTTSARPTTTVKAPTR